MGLIDYKNKVCVVTGAASGIGLATVKLLLEEGADVYAMDLAYIWLYNKFFCSMGFSRYFYWKYISFIL